MNKNLKTKIVLLVISTALIFANLNAYAASLFFETQNPKIQQNSDFAVDVLADSQGQSINAIQGEIYFPTDKIKLQNIYEGDSIINFWIEKPKQISDNLIAWSGIVPGGFKGVLKPDQQNAYPGKIFTLVFKAEQLGQIEIGFKNSQVLLNDGRGTQADLTTSPIDFQIYPFVQNNTNPSLAISNDHNPPDPFVIMLSRNADMFNGKWFINFNTQDKETGVASYGIVESLYALKNIASSEWKTAESPYVLTDQSLSSYVYVQAVDYNGNARIEVLPPAHPYNIWIVYIYLLVAIVIALIAILWLTKKYKNK